ncbi:hypothetical protein [Psychromicrobium lacuslunae]|uniref:Phage head-tail adapter protein n=1 Tax=Psychromicrobium lacuslunae TaxID=1618207 RepID=A0A0D4C149_9MICC|nr:hypothetical protein [Psychromicrobium lacuslunae]AJT42417.1 hypothetical protein UM93_14590 [Psychromicrobium lacuslunae]
MLPSLMRQSFTRLRAPLVDDGHDNETQDWSKAQALEISNCLITPGATDEVIANRNGVLIQFTVHAPAGADVQALDRAIYQGVEYEIDGEPERWDTGVLDHTVIYLKKWRG